MIKKIKNNFNDENTYIIFENFSKQCIVIDPCEPQTIENFLCEKDLLIEYVVLTHEHFDHICGLNRLRELHSFQVICSRNCSIGIQDSKINMSKYFNVLLYFKGDEPGEAIEEYFCEAAEVTFEDSFEFEWLRHRVCFYETPGHTKGSSIIIYDGKQMFSGDTIMINLPTSTKFIGGSQKEYEDITIPLIKQLGNLEVLPGHGQNFLLNNWRESYELRK